MLILLRVVIADFRRFVEGFFLDKTVDSYIISLPEAFFHTIIRRHCFGATAAEGY